MIRFGTGGWRAEIGKDFHMDNVCRIGQALADIIQADGQGDKPVVIGYDRRFLSDEAAKWLAETLAGNGVPVLFLRRSAPTPLIMHTVKKQGLHYGLEVTASHNPATYNGIKVVVAEGRDAPADFTARIEAQTDAGGESRRTPFESAVQAGLIRYAEHPFNDFLDDILGVLDTEAIRARGPRILFDSMHGSSTYPLMVIFHTTRCTVDLIHSNKDAYFGGMMPAPTENTLYDLSRQVLRGGYDLGIGVDGDGDRLGIIDADGSYISANDILLLLYYYLHEYKGWRGPVVRNVASTHLLDALAKDLGEVCYEVPVGFKYISSKIDEVDAVLGGESSGGLTVRGHIHGKDSVYAASLFVEMLAKTGRTAGELLGELRKKYGARAFVEANLRFDPARKQEINDTVMVQRALPDFALPVDRVSYMDGCKVYFEDDSFVICRFSGTEPLLRIFAEARSEEDARSLVSAWERRLSLGA